MTYPKVSRSVGWLALQGAWYREVSETSSTGVKCRLFLRPYTYGRGSGLTAIRIGPFRVTFSYASTSADPP